MISIAVVKTSKKQNLGRKYKTVDITLTLIWVEVEQGAGNSANPRPCWFFFSNSETVKTVTLAFCWIP